MTTYFVNDIYTSIQGEGVNTGVAMVLVRLHGCAVGCPWCDTKETWNFDQTAEVDSLPEILGRNSKYTRATADEILNYVQQNHPGPKWVLVTGGEPADYPLKPLVDALHQGGYKVALETSGTAKGHIGAGIDWICVSPKINMPGGKTVFPEAVAVADELKFVVGRPKDIQIFDDLLEKITLKPEVHLCLQPVSRSQKATELCLETVKRRGWRVSFQIHKFLQVP